MTRSWRSAHRPVLVRLARRTGWLLGCVLAAAMVGAPVAAEQAVEHVRFDDRLGAFPVEVALAHDGVSSVDTGLVGTVYVRRTGFAGFGAALRSTGPPAADGTLSSYVSPEFLQVNAAFVDDPDEVQRVYGAELRGRVLRLYAAYDGAAGLGGGLLLALLLRGAAPPVPARVRRTPTRVLLRGGYLVGLVAGSSLVAVVLFSHWDGSAEIGTTYTLPGVDEVSFSSPQALEVARQVQPFIEKNTTRIAERSAAYRAAAVADLETTLPEHADGLAARDGERVVISEADPQGSRVATRVRTALYPMLEDLLGDDTIVLRTVAGDVTSNGTVAEKGFVRSEATASGDIPTVAAKGDHDSTETVEQLRDAGVEVPDLEVVDVGGLRVAAASDPAFKALFGGLVTNPSGTTEAELGQALREVVDDELDGDADGAVDVVLHQPRAVAGYLGIGSTADLAGTVGHETVPDDDGLPDVPPGMVQIGHLHDAAGPWVVWNTDGDEVTWTVVSQLGTSGGVEENPTFNRFSTPFSVPLKDVSVRLAYINPGTGLQTGYASVVIAPDGSVTVEDRVDVGLPGGEPVPVSELGTLDGTVDGGGADAG